MPVVFLGSELLIIKILPILCSLRRVKPRIVCLICFIAESEEKNDPKSFGVTDKEVITSGSDVKLGRNTLSLFIMWLVIFQNHWYSIFFNLGLDRLCLAILWLFQQFLASIASGPECSKLQTTPLLLIDVDVVFMVSYG